MERPAGPIRLRRRTGPTLSVWLPPRHDPFSPRRQPLAPGEAGWGGDLGRACHRVVLGGAGRNVDPAGEGIGRGDGHQASPRLVFPPVHPAGGPGAPG
ncbi:MAG: hypothetical protein ACK55I_35565, partial [bacterium]